MTDMSAWSGTDAAVTLGPLSAVAPCPACHGPRAGFLFNKDGYDIVRCPDCGFLFVHPYPDDEALARHYETTYRGANADFYPKAGSRRWRGFWRSLQFVKYVRGKAVLDLGCGGGFMTESFARLGASAIGIDVSRNSIAFAQKHFPQCRFYCESLAEFRHRKWTFDFVFSSEVLEHLPGPTEFMETVAAVTLPGGYVYVSAPDAGHPAVPADITKWGDICPPEHLQWFNKDNLVMVFKQYGFVLHRDFGSDTPAHSLIFQNRTGVNSCQTGKFNIGMPAVTPTLVPKPPPKFKRHQPWPDWVDAVIAEWRQLWPETFSKPLPLAIGITSQIKSLYHPDDTSQRKKKAIGVSLRFWSTQSSYLRAVARGETRRNLDGSEAGVPDEATRLEARRLLDERRDRRKKRKREREDSTSVVPPSYLPLTADSSSEVDCPPIILTRGDNVKADSDRSAAP